MRSVYEYSPLDDGAYARISFLEQRQIHLENECMQQAELVEELEAQINSLEEQLVKKTEKNHELEDSLVVSTRCKRTRCWQLKSIQFVNFSTILRKEPRFDSS